MPDAIFRPAQRALRAGEPSPGATRPDRRCPAHPISFLPALPRPERSRPAIVLRPARLRGDGGGLPTGTVTKRAAGERAGPRRFRQRVLLPAYGLEALDQGLARPAQPRPLPSVRLPHR